MADIQTIDTAIDSLVTATGEVQTTPTANTVLARLKDLLSLIVLATGTNAIGKLAANSGVDIGDVDVTSLPSVTTATPTAVTVGNTSTAVLASNAARKFAIFVNDSSEAIYLALAATAVMNQGIRLNAYGGAFEINLLNLYTGAVTAICTSGSKVLCVTSG